MVEKYHNLIYRVIHDNHLEAYTDDIYGDAVLQMMVAARGYLNSSQQQKYSYTTIAYKQINKVCRMYIAKELIHSRQIVSLDDDDLKLYSVLATQEYETSDNEQSCKHCSLAMALLTEKEQEAIQRHADGLNSKQVERIYGVNNCTHRHAVERARKKCYAHYGEIWGTDEVVEMPKQKTKRCISKEEGALIKKMYRGEGMKVYPISRKLGRQASVIRAYLIREGVIDG